MVHNKKARLEVLAGWKEIANYLQRGVPTVQRYEREFGLPIRRPAAKSKGAVVATKVELDAWVAASPLRDALPLRRSPLEYLNLLQEFRRRLVEMQKLHHETAALRDEVEESLRPLEKNLRSTFPEADFADRASLKRVQQAVILSFDPNKNKIQ